MTQVEYVLTYCRYCLNEEDLLEAVVEPEIVESIFNVQIHRSIDIPPFMCKPCKESLDLANKFVNVIRQSQETLASLERNGDLRNDLCSLNITTKNEDEQEDSEMIEEVLDEDFIIDHEEDGELGNRLIGKNLVNPVMAALKEVVADGGDDSDAETISASENEEEKEPQVDMGVKKIKTVLDGRTVEIITQPSKLIRFAQPPPPPPLVSRPRKSARSKLHPTTKAEMLYELEFPSMKCSQMTDEELKQYMEDNNRINSFYEFNCPICRLISFESYAYYKYHMRKAHKEKLVHLYCCKRKLSTRTALLEHIDYHTNPSKLTCKKCGRLCRDKRTLNIHLEYHRDPDAFKTFLCSFCEKRFASKRAVDMHEETHLPKRERQKLKVISCPQCNKKYSTETLLNVHIKTFHMKKYAKICNLCGKNFLSKSALTYHHKHTHTEEAITRPHRCEECNVGFSSEERLNGHIKRSHEEVGICSCEECGKEFASLSSLKSHTVYAHQMTRKFECEVCGKGFKIMKLLQEHKSIHTGIPLYKCDFCTKTFNSNANMYSHRKKQHFQQHQELVEARRTGVKIEHIQVD